LGKLAGTGYEENMKIEPCVRCGRALKTAENINESGDPAVVTYLLLKTTGIRPRAIAHARRRSICMPCSVSIALGPSPNSGAFNEDVYEGLIELNQKTPTLGAVAHEQKFNPPSRPRLMPGSKPDDTLTTKVLSGPFRDEEKLAGTG
jgi:hypothetical protein